RRSPGHLILVGPTKPAPTGDRLVTEIRAPKPNVVGKDLGDDLEQPSGLRRRAQVAHMVGKDVEERIELIAPESHRDAVFLRASNLASHLGIELLHKPLWIARQIEHDGDLPGRNRKSDLKRPPASELQELDAILPRLTLREFDEGENRFIGTQGAAVIHERHGHEIMPEERTLHANKRQNTDQRAVRPSGEIGALVMEHALHDGAPAEEMKVRPTRSAPDELVPFVRLAREPFDRDHALSCN